MLDDAHLGRQRDNRWSALGVRAYYFATDIGLIAAEYGRHIELELPSGRSERLARAMFEVVISLDRCLDLTDPAVVAAMGAESIERWILDREATQAAASYLRAQIPDLQGLLVPSVAFLDHPERHNVVVYRDRIDPATAFAASVFVRDLVLEALGGPRAPAPDEGARSSGVSDTQP